MVSILFYKIQVSYFDFAARNNEANCCLTGATPATLLGIHIIVREWSIVLNLANVEGILSQVEFKMVALILTLHQYPQKCWDSLSGRMPTLWKVRAAQHQKYCSPQTPGSSRRLWIETLSIKEMENWARCRQKIFVSASDHRSVST